MRLGRTGSGGFGLIEVGLDFRMFSHVVQTRTRFLIQSRFASILASHWQMLQSCEFDPTEGGSQTGMPWRHSKQEMHSRLNQRNMCRAASHPATDLRLTGDHLLLQPTQLPAEEGHEGDLSKPGQAKETPSVRWEGRTAKARNKKHGYPVLALPIHSDVPFVKG